MRLWIYWCLRSVHPSDVRVIALAARTMPFSCISSYSLGRTTSETYSAESGWNSMADIWMPMHNVVQRAHQMDVFSDCVRISADILTRSCQQSKQGTIFDPGRRRRSQPWIFWWSWVWTRIFVNYGIFKCRSNSETIFWSGPTIVKRNSFVCPRLFKILPPHLPLYLQGKEKSKRDVIMWTKILPENTGSKYIRDPTRSWWPDTG